jgi:hypothetical protein
MSLIGSINRFIDLFIDSFRELRRGRIWLLLGAYLGLQWLVLYAHVNFSSPLVWGAMKIWLGFFPDSVINGFKHFPGHFLTLPYVFDWARFVIGLVLEGLVLGGIAMLFFDNMLETPKEDRLSLKLLWPSWIHLALAWLVLNGLMLATAVALPGWLESWLEGSPRRQLFIQLGVIPGIFVVLLALLYFAIPSVALFGENVWQAIKRSIRLFFRHPISLLILSGLILVGPVAVSAVAGRAGLIIDKFRPEMVYWVLVAGLVVGALASFFWMGTAVRFLIDEED